MGKEEPELSTGRDTSTSYTKEHLHLPSADFDRQGERTNKREISIKAFKIKFAVLRKQKKKEWILDWLCSKNYIYKVFYCKTLYRHKHSHLNISVALKLKIS